MKTIWIGVAASAVAAVVAGCVTTPTVNIPGPNERVTYENSIRSLLEVKCYECHGSDSPSMEEFKKDEEQFKKDKTGPRFDSYENLMVVVNGSDTGALMRRLDDGTNTKDGKPGNMHKKLGESDAERAANLALVKRWVGGWTLKKAKDISEEERQGILAPLK